MQDITALLPCGVMVLNAESAIVSLNPYACTLLGYKAEELIGKRVDTLLTMASRIYFQTHLYPLIVLRNAASELYLNLQSRQRLQIPILMNAIRQEENGGVYTYFTFIPVNQRRQYEQDLLAAKKAAEHALLRNEKLLEVQRELEQHQVELDRKVSQLRQRSEELEQFGKIVSHDLQEPLRKIMVFADLLENEQSDSQVGVNRMVVAGIRKASARLRLVIKDLQLYFNQTSQLSQTAPVDLNAVVQEVSREYESSNILFDLKTLPTVMGSELELMSLFRSLIDNAMKFSKSGQQAIVNINGSVVGHNSFQTTPDKYKYVDYARISISDNGIGFDNRQAEEVFRIMRKLNRHTPGIGLGLAMAKKIVERHNGQIWAESVVGKGTTIRVLLPIA